MPRVKETKDPGEAIVPILIVQPHQENSAITLVLVKTLSQLDRNDNSDCGQPKNLHIGSPAPERTTMATDWSGSLQSSLTLTKCWCLTVSPCASLPEQSIELAFNPPQGCLRDRVVACVVRLMISEPPKEEARFFFGSFRTLTVA